MRSNLTIKQWKFALEYLCTINASESYRRVYNAVNMKNKTIHNRAYELKKHPLVSKYIRQLQKELRSRYDK